MTKEFQIGVASEGFQIGVADIIQPKYLPGTRIWTISRGSNTFVISGQIVEKVRYLIEWKVSHSTQVRDEALEYRINSQWLDESKLYPSYEAALTKLAEFNPKEPKPND